MTADEAPLAPARLALGPTLDLCAAAALAGELMALRGQPLEIDASEVQRLGGQCVQVLLSARATWTADNQALTISSPSSAFTDGISLLGVSALDHVPTI